MAHPATLREAYPEDKLLRFLFILDEHPILYARPLLQSALPTILQFLLTHWRRISVLYFAAVIGLTIRIILTNFDTVCIYLVGAGLIVLALWMFAMFFYSTYLNTKYFKHQEMLESQATGNADISWLEEEERMWDVIRADLMYGTWEVPILKPNVS